jgi:hypothetical protein
MFTNFPLRYRWLIALGLLLALVASAAAQTPSIVGTSGPAHAADFVAGGAAGTGNTVPPDPAGAWQPVPGHPDMLVGQSLHNDTSPPLRDLPPALPALSPHREREPAHAPMAVQPRYAADGALQANPSTLSMPPPLLTHDGINLAGGCGDCTPPDANGDVGLTQYVQAVNDSFEVLNKDMSVALSARPIATLWRGFGGACEGNGQGDPIVLYDRSANNWLISQFAFAVDGDGNPLAPYFECFAVSTSNDATGTFHRYAFLLSLGPFPDYPKLGVWRDGYYMSEVEYDGDTSTPNPRPLVFNRSQMLAGVPAQFLIMPRQSNASPLLPGDQESVGQGAPGEPDFYASLCAFAPASCLNLFRFHVDWNTPGNSAWTLAAVLTPTHYNELCLSTRNCIPQPNFQYLDALGDRLMHRLSWRRMAINGVGHDVLLVTHSVDTGSSHAGVRWYEILDPDSTPTIAQQSTFAPDNDNRWMASIAMDQDGNIGLGYSVSSLTTLPAIRYSGRRAGDPPNTLRAEGTIVDGNGAQAESNRWGDYSSMSLDPSDGCTFWYTNEFYGAGFSTNWRTKIGTFQFASCGH